MTQYDANYFRLSEICIFVSKFESMKRFALSVAVLLTLAYGLSSCEKCTVCTAQTIDGDVVTEWCGNELDVRDFEKYFIDRLLNQADSTPGYCERGPDL